MNLFRATRGPNDPGILVLSLAGKRKEYDMGEGGGFLKVWAVVSLMNPELPMACLITKSALESELTNLLVGLMEV